MRWTARALATPSADTDTCLSVFFESQPALKYIFNCGESTFKSIQQRKYGMTKFKALFLTSIDSETSSGLPGFLMSFADSGSRELTIVGPPGLNHMLATSRSYAMREALELNRIECRPSNSSSSKPPLVFNDENLSIFAVPCLPSPALVDADQSASIEDLSSASITERIVQQIYSGRRFTEGESKPKVPFDWRLHRSLLPKAPRATTRVNYIGVGPIVRGKFDAKRATELGVLGPSRAFLTKGQSVLSNDGVTMVTPDMCIGPSSPASAFMIVDCPSPSYIEGIVSSDSLNFSKHFPDARLGFILHKAGPGILEDRRYLEWMNSFDSKAEHLIAQRDYCSNEIAFTSSAKLLLGLSELDSEMFVYPKPSPPRRSLLDKRLPPNTYPLQLDHLIGMNPGVPAKISPTAGLVDDFAPALEAKLSGKRDSSISPDLVKFFDQIQTEVSGEARIRERQAGDDVVITTLGTGSALPSKYRNVLSTLVQIPEWGSVLLDAGEGTWGQLSRRFGSELSDSEGPHAESPADKILRDIRCIFISHLHADHHMGLAKLLALRQKLNPPPERPLFLVAGQETMDYLAEYDNLEDLGLQHIRFIENSEIANPPSLEERRFAVRAASINYEERRLSSLEARETVMAELGLTSLETVGVSHRGPCYGIVLRHKDGWSLAFSGDTVPSENLVQAGKGVTVLIHEASLSSDEAEIALAKQHSTVGQAINVGKRMGAQNILLTHFSQRYPKIPSLQSAAPPVPVESSSTMTTTIPGEETSENHSGARTSADPSIEPPVAIAFDCVSIPIGSLWKMSRYTPALERVFAELADAGAEDEEETVLRASAMGIPVESLGPVGPSSSTSPSKTGRKSQARAGGPSPVTKAAKKQKISANKSKAVA